MSKNWRKRRKAIITSVMEEEVRLRRRLNDLSAVSQAGPDLLAASTIAGRLEELNATMTKERVADAERQKRNRDTKRAGMQ